MIKVALKYGIVNGAFLIILFLVGLSLGIHPFLEIRHLFFDFTLFGLFIFFTLNEFKRYRNDGILHFWQGMSLGFYVIVIAIALYVIFIGTYIDPDFIAEYQKLAHELLAAKVDQFPDDFNESQLAAHQQAIDQLTEWRLISQTAVKKIVTGFFVTPVISIFLRRNK
ncbi:MAG: DUF4199 domain-containing protein [Cyclobacteriaceae bacterium]